MSNKKTHSKNKLFIHPDRCETYEYRPDIFTKAGTYNPEIGDHCLIYGLINEKVTHYKPKTILCRNLKTIDLELLTDDLSNAPWHVGDIFTEIDHRIAYWNGLMNYVIAPAGISPRRRNPEEAL